MKKFLFLFSFSCCLILVHAQTAIKMEKTGGVYKVPCKINGLSLKFIFDTGASDVSLSLTEALFMLKNDYLSEKDFIGTEYYRIANGDLQEGTTVNLKCVEIGGQKIYNVQASISHTIDAPLLFGQSALQRFGKVSIDYSTNTLLLGVGNSNGNAPKATSIDIVSKKDTGFIGAKEIKIGEQVWMTENLNVSTFGNGVSILEAKTDEEWQKAAENGTPAWCYYDNDLTNGKKYGKLYNGYVVVNSLNVCPNGWHVPRYDEFVQLTDYLGGEKLAGGKMKSVILWSSPNTGADNASGFSALPSGVRYFSGPFDYLGETGRFWSTTEGGPYARSSTNVLFLNLKYNLSSAEREDSYKGYGFPIRCVRD